jgi:ribosomal protein S6--L-glutamate ligase
MAAAVVAHQAEPTNTQLAAELGAELLSPWAALGRLVAGDLALGRIDVRRTLDGCEPGLELLDELERLGIEVLNRRRPLLTVHDKLRTARSLGAAGVPHPHTWHITTALELLAFQPPVIVKPRFGSWGGDVVRCRTRAELDSWAAVLRGRPWFSRTGAVVQELLPPPGHDLRLLVARGRVVGAAERLAARGEWRTNVSLGAAKRPVDPPDFACDLALEAASAVGIDVAGVDLLPVGDSYVVIELNGAADFDEMYSLAEGDVYADLRDAIGVATVARAF